MNKRRRKLFMATLLVLGGLAALAVRLFPPPEPLLLQHAVKVTEVQENGTYCWLSSRELLVVTNTSRSPDPWSQWSGYVESIDPQSGKRTRLEGLTDAIMRHASHFNALHGPETFTLSPDGQWLYWHCLPPAGGTIALMTARKDGSGYHEWPEQGIYFAKWIDGHRWGVSTYPRKSHFGESAPTGFIVHDAEHPNADRLLPISSPEAQKFMSSSDGHTTSKQAGMLSANPDDKGSRVEISIMSTPVGAVEGTLPSTLDVLIYPEGSWLTTAESNAQQTRILLFVHDSGIPPWVTFVRKLLPSYSYSAHPFEHLIVYRPDTTEVVGLGRIDAVSAYEAGRMMMGWLPDGTHIQFFYKNAVYIVAPD